MINMTPSMSRGASAASLSHAVSKLARPFRQAAAWVHERNHTRRGQQHAATLDDRMLEDVGLTRADLRREGVFGFLGR